MMLQHRMIMHVFSTTVHMTLLYGCLPLAFLGAGGCALVTACPESNCNRQHVMSAADNSATVACGSQAWLSLFVLLTPHVATSCCSLPCVAAHQSLVPHALLQLVWIRCCRQAAAERAEGEKVTRVKAAEAEAEARYLQGLGISRQRQAILNGLRDSVADFSGEWQAAYACDVAHALSVKAGARRWQPCPEGVVAYQTNSC